MQRKYLIGIWLLIFAIIFLLSMDFWAWNRKVELYWLNLPGWVYYFIGLQVLFIIALIVFAYGFWDKVFGKEEENK